MALAEKSLALPMLSRLFLFYFTRPRSLSGESVSSLRLLYGDHHHHPPHSVTKETIFFCFFCKIVSGFDESGKKSTDRSRLQSAPTTLEMLKVDSLTGERCGFINKSLV